MATRLKNLSDHNPSTVPDGSSLKFGIVVSEWNEEITAALLDGAIQTLKKHGVDKDRIFIKTVPGSFELPFGARIVAEKYNPDAVICLGCVIQGVTRHFEYICQGVTRGITELNLDYEIPFIFGVLTTNNMRQARNRSGGKHGNKGDEAAITALKMASLRSE